LALLSLVRKRYKIKVYDLVSGKRTYGLYKTKIGQVSFRTSRPRWQPYGKILENIENTKPIWQGKGKKDERATRRFPGSLSSGILRRTFAHADERNKETRGKESTIGGMAKPSDFD